MKDHKDNATLELPGFELPPPFDLPDQKKIIPTGRKLRRRQEQLDLLAELGPTDVTGLPAWIKDESLDDTGLPVWRSEDDEQDQQT